jgi:hypothetical protein
MKLEYLKKPEEMEKRRPKLKSLLVASLVFLFLLMPVSAQHPQLVSLTCGAGLPTEATIYLDYPTPINEVVENRIINLKVAVVSNDPMMYDITYNFTHDFDTLNIAHSYNIMTLPNPLMIPFNDILWTEYQYTDDVNGMRDGYFYLTNNVSCTINNAYFLDTAPNNTSTDFTKGAIIISLTALSIVLVAFMRGGKKDGDRSY